MALNKTAASASGSSRKPKDLGKHDDDDPPLFPVVPVVVVVVVVVGAVVAAVGACHKASMSLLVDNVT